MEKRTIGFEENQTTSGVSGHGYGDGYGDGHGDGYGDGYGHGDGYGW